LSSAQRRESKKAFWKTVRHDAAVEERRGTPLKNHGPLVPMRVWPARIRSYRRGSVNQEMWNAEDRHQTEDPRITLKANKLGCMTKRKVQPNPSARFHNKAALLHANLQRLLSPIDNTVRPTHKYRSRMKRYTSQAPLEVKHFSGDIKKLGGISRRGLGGEKKKKSRKGRSHRQKREAKAFGTERRLGPVVTNFTDAIY